MRKYAFSVLSLIVLLALIQTSHAALQSCESPRLYCSAWTDRPYYNPGDAGKLTIDLKNLYSYPIQVNNLEITFPWSAYINGQWDGNLTISLTNMNTTSGQWIPEQSAGFTVPTDGRFPTTAFTGSSVTIGIHYIAYCTGCIPGERRTDSIFGVSILPNAFLITTGWVAISNYLLYTDILLGALVGLFLVHIFWSRQKTPTMPR